MERLSLELVPRGSWSLLSAGRRASAKATYFTWKKKFDGMTPPEMRRLKQLEDENGKLRKLVADLSALVPDACRRPPKGGGLAQVLQRGPSTWSDRP
jgi:hypothetical protein